MRKRLLARGHYDASDITRFMDRVSPEPNSGCWLWDGSTFKGRQYGQFSIANRMTVQAHRFSYFMSRGEPVRSGGHLICHTCDNPCCVNPDHLWEGSCADNMIDKRSKGRAPRLLGTLNGMAKIDPEIVKSIRADSRGHTSVANAYGLSVSHVHCIRKNKSWRHVK
jgi:hypothetical protein